MTEPPKRTSVFKRTVVGVILILPFVVFLWIPSYNKLEPRIGGFPFFYWWQLLWVFLTGALLWVAYLLMRTKGGKGE